MEMVPVSDAKAHLNELVNKASDRSIVLLSRSRPKAVLLSYDRWIEMRRESEDLKDRLALFQSRVTSPDMRLTHDKVLAELGLLGTEDRE